MTMNKPLFIDETAEFQAVGDVILDEHLSDNFLITRCMGVGMNVMTRNGTVGASALWEVYTGENHITFVNCMIRKLIMTGGKVTLINSTVHELELSCNAVVVLSGVDNYVGHVVDYGQGKIIGTTVGCPPDKEEFTMYKAAFFDGRLPVLVTLRVPADALRTGHNEIRVNRAFVEKIEDDAGNTYECANSIVDCNFIYRAGSWVAEDGYCKSTSTCAPGIHGFLSKAMARQYGVELKH